MVVDVLYWLGSECIWFKCVCLSLLGIGGLLFK